VNVYERAAIHAALGDPGRLRIVDQLQLGDRTFQELADASGLPGNLAAHHLNVLQEAGLIDRRVSDGDHRRRYISLRHDRLAGVALSPARLDTGFVVFVCNHNSARSQFAAKLWKGSTGGAADSAGTEPAPRVHPLALEVAHEFGVDLSGAIPKPLAAVQQTPDLVISVCDRAHESTPGWANSSLHWSIPDPVKDGGVEAFRTAFTEIAARVDRLAEAQQN
jgi:ArsR family transcriptional regulator, arsenate/arsenite/antimonite-responsive transcriptional repressor / arsenate reductase (thioredoxin)